MKISGDALKWYLNKTHVGLERCRWDKIFESEDELIEAMFNEKVEVDEKTTPNWRLCIGYEYIKSFKEYYEKNGTLTEKQMRQLKRLAGEIAYRIYCN